MVQRRVNIITAVNASNVSKTGSIYVIKDVVHAIDGIVLNRRLYPGKELQKSVTSLEGKPAPAGHPKDSQGRHISATNGEALAASWIGAYCTNSRYEGGRAKVDIVINGDQANAMDAGRRVIKRLDAAIAGTDTKPVGVSSGLFLEEVAANGESLGKKYDAIATNMKFDHVAILLDERPAGTPEEGVGMFLNSEGSEEPVEEVVINTEPEDRRGEGLLANAKALIRRLLGNGTTDVSFDQISSGLYGLLPEGAWLQEVFDRYAIWRDRDGKFWRQDYSVSSETASVAWTSSPVEVVRRVDYQPVTNQREDDDEMKEQILAALNAAGVKVEGLTDGQILSAYNALVIKPVEEKLTAANSKLVEIELAANAAKDAEAETIAKELAANTSLTVEDLKKLGLDRLKELQGNSKKAAPVTPGAGGEKDEGEFKGYSLNALMSEEKK